MTATTHTQPLPADWRDFFALTKPRVMSLVIFTGLCGLLAAPVPIHPVLGFTAILCIAVGAGGAAALNQWWEADLDAGMKRTSGRPIPSGRMDRDNARDFGVALSAASVFLMGVAIGWLAAAILAISNSDMEFPADDDRGMIHRTQSNGRAASSTGRYHMGNICPAVPVSTTSISASSSSRRML